MTRNCSVSLSDTNECAGASSSAPLLPCTPMVCRYSTTSYWVGAFRVSAATNWTWVDNTPPSNIACGARGCGLWYSTEGASSTEFYAVVAGSLSNPMGLNDFGVVDNYVTHFPCELPNPVPAGWYAPIGFTTKVLSTNALAASASFYWHQTSVSFSCYSTPAQPDSTRPEELGHAHSVQLVAMGHEP